MGLLLWHNMADPVYERWFLTWPMSDDRHDSWVRIEAPSKEHARTFAVRQYGTGWAELLDDLSFNPDLFVDGEIAAFRVENPHTAPQRLGEEPKR